MTWLSVFDFSGRIGRARFWWRILAAIAVLTGLLFCFWAYALSIPGAYENGGPTPFPGDPPGIAGAVLFFALLAVSLVAGLSTAAKRLHDRGKAWWWLLVFVIVPDLLTGFAQYEIDMGRGVTGDVPFLAWFAGLALFGWGIIELGFLRGTPGENAYGPDPLA